ncbi:MAG: ABC transporter permease [Candidatus Eremiobacteraeota bacterium]|nr:ABC transporter permease [Candidatus Eremiobacteraeota bacterium]
MFNYVVRRTVEAIPLLLLISVILFAILSNAPGGPLAPYLQNPHITAADIARLKHNLGLDDPIYIQYIKWIARVVGLQSDGESQHFGNFGYSTSNSETVTAAILERMPATLLLMGSAFTFSLIVGVAFGIIAAIKPYSSVDYLVTTFAFFGQSMPVFWFALMLQLAFAVNGINAFGYHIALPSAGLSNSDDFNIGDRLQHLILPTIVLSLLFLATWSRFTRSSMLEVLKTDYMRTAAAKGLDKMTIIMRHGLKNALMPVVTIVALSLPGLVAGAVVTETIFAWPGMGRLFINALGQFDFSLLMGYLMMVSFLVVFFNLVADVAYAWLDPRVKYD